MANVLIEESTLTAIGDAIRAKTGKTDLILPSDMAMEIAEITGGGTGGSSELVKYVTFMSEDSLTELFKMPVLSGDDCKDPVEHGDIEAPTKESTDTTNYTHSGWALSSGGTADSTALQNVTADRTVYATYAESIRYYTVNFYTEVGVLYETVQVTYGGTATPSVKPTKEGVVLNGWQPSNENIIADTDCYAVWLEAITFADSAWSDIARVCEAGNASKYFSVGDIREITWTNKSGTSIVTQFQIVGIDHDNLADGSGKAGISVLSVPVINHSNYSTTNPTPPYQTKAWDNCVMREQLNSEFYKYLPSDLKTHIKEVLKISSGTRTNTFSAVETVDKIWIPSHTELTNKTNTYGSKIMEGEHYEIFSDDESRIKYLQGTDGAVETTAIKYHTRSTSGYSASNYFCSIKTTGSAQWNDGSVNYHAPIGFCI